MTRLRTAFGIWVLISSAWIAGINLAAELLTRPSVDWPELLGRTRYWEVMLAVPVGLAAVLILRTVAKRWR